LALDVVEDRATIANPDTITPEQFVEALHPQGAFKPVYKDYLPTRGGERRAGYHGRDIYMDFQEDVYNHQNITGEPSFGSYFLYEMNNDTKQFKVGTFANLT
jgi:hypothetical protein